MALDNATVEAWIRDKFADYIGATIPAASGFDAVQLDSDRILVEEAVIVNGYRKWTSVPVAEVAQQLSETLDVNSTDEIDFQCLRAIIPVGHVWCRMIERARDEGAIADNSGNP